MARGNDWLRYRASSDGLDWAEASFRDLRFSPHRHDTYAIGVTTRGVQAFTYRGAARAASPGDVFVLHPDELHDGRPGGAEGFGYRIVYVDPALIGRALGGGPLPFVVDPVCRAPALQASLRAVFPDPADPAEELRETDAVAALAAALATAARLPARPRTAVSATVRRLREQLAATPGRRFSMAALEREHGLDRFTLARQFRRAFGVSPSRFVTLRRLERAQRLIAAGAPLAEAAVAAGFADQAHLTRHFRAAYGTTPGRWRALLRAAAEGGLARRRGCASLLPMTPAFTHLALHVRDLDACIAFYRDFCGMRLVHERDDDGTRVVWLAEPGREKEFIIVLLPGGPGRDQQEGDFSHLGFALDSKAAVDAIAARGEAAGCLAWAPRDEAFPVGYYCGLRDPDGNFVEFSYGQPLGPGAP